MADSLNLLVNGLINDQNHFPLLIKNKMNISGNLFQNIYHYRYLLVQMTKREISYRYRGSMLGFAWSFLNPLLMLAVYTFVFSVVFRARWGTGGESESRLDFAIILFAGLIVFNLFAEIMTRAPNLILGNVNYVKKVIFPLELLPLISINVVFFHSFISLTVLLVAQLVFRGYVPSTVIFFPVILLPLLIISLGLSWCLAALTVYIRDVAYLTNIFVTVLMFISAVFFPISALPEKYQFIIRLNPVAVIVSESRNVLILGQSPDWAAVGLIFVGGVFLAMGGYWWFQKIRKGFADVL